MVLEILVDIEGVEVFGIKTGEQHIHHDRHVNLLLVGQVLVGVLLVLDALLHILIVTIEFANAVVGAKACVVICNDDLERGFFLIRGFIVVSFFLRQVFLNLLHVFVAFGRRRKHAGDIQWLKIGVCGLLLGLNVFEQGMIFHGVFVQNGFDDFLFLHTLARLGLVLALGLVMVDMEAKYVAIGDGVGDGVCVQFPLKDVFRGFVRCLLAFNLLVNGVVAEDGRAGKAEQLSLGEKFLDGLMVLAELRAVAFVEDEYDTLVDRKSKRLNSSHQII